MAKKPTKSTAKRTTTLDVNSPKLRNFIVSALKEDGETTFVAEIASGRATLRVNPALVAKFLEKTKKKARRKRICDGPDNLGRKRLTILLYALTHLAYFTKRAAIQSGFAEIIYSLLESRYFFSFKNFSICLTKSPKIKIVPK